LAHFLASRVVSAMRHGLSSRLVISHCVTYSSCASNSMVQCFCCNVCFGPLQAKIGEVYPCHYSIAALVCFFGAIQSTVMAVCVQRDKEQWRLGFNIRLYSSAYAVSAILFIICQESSPLCSSQSKEFSVLLVSLRA
jgi:hypothetical protein